ncbi:MAG: tRNA pseudouridine(38-40) synthase TruA [Gemmatimonadota bacterium]
MEGALERLFGGRRRISAAGRTDAGVHATAQEILIGAPARWSAEELRRALAAVLPDDVGVVAVGPAPEDFHPRYSATGRRYEYFVAPGPDGTSPLRAARVWRHGGRPALDALRRASPPLLGAGDFAALSRTGPPERGCRCTIERAEWLATPAGDLRFVVVADRFLHRMVRYLVAVMMDVATGRRGPDELRALLSGRPGVRPPEPAPAEGLYLTGVRYRDGWNREPGVPGLWPLHRRAGETSCPGSTR